MKAIHLKISGRVQGVFFRTETKQRADELGLTGWVRNCNDGSVEIFAQGPEEKLLNLKKWCENGPTTAKVEKIEELSTEPQECSGFEIR